MYFFILALALSNDMIPIPAGSYKLFIRRGSQNKTDVKSFQLDKFPVTISDYLSFLKANPKWQRSKVSRLFADKLYLKSWVSDLAPGPDRILESPITEISWFAAKAYCAWRKKRLPSVDEWEYAALETPSEKILQWYSKPTTLILSKVGSTFINRFGTYDLHGLVWEWVSDFNTDTIENDSARFCGAGSVNSKDLEDYASFMRFAFRQSLNACFGVSNLGFRCAI